MNHPAMNFGGRIVYSRTIEQVEQSTLQVLRLLEAKKSETGRAVIGIDIEWKPSFNRGGFTCLFYLLLGFTLCLDSAKKGGK